MRAGTVRKPAGHTAAGGLGTHAFRCLGRPWGLLPEPHTAKQQSPVGSRRRPQCTGRTRGSSARRTVPSRASRHCSTGTLKGMGIGICAVNHPPQRQTCSQPAPSTDPRQVGGEATDPVPVSAHSQTVRPMLPHLVMSLWRARLRRWYDTHQEQKMEVQQTVVGVGVGHDEQATPSASAGVRSTTQDRPGPYIRGRRCRHC